MKAPSSSLSIGPGSGFESFFTTPFTPDPLIVAIPSLPIAPVSVSRLTDTDFYDGATPEVTLGALIGLAEYGNANFIVEDTAFTEDLPPDDRHFSPFPRFADTIELTITNRSSEAMEGTFTLYADDTGETRGPVAAWELALAPGGSTLTPLAFSTPSEPKSYNLVFEGRLGTEEGAVAGKVQPQHTTEFVKQLNTNYYDVRLFSSGSGDCAQDRCWGSSATGVERRRSSVIQETTFHRVIEIILKAMIDETLAAKLGLPPGAVGTTRFLDFRHVTSYEVQTSEPEVIVGDAQTPVTSFTPFGDVLWDDYLPQGGRTERSVVVTQGAGLESEQQFFTAPNRSIHHTLSLEFRRMMVRTRPLFSLIGAFYACRGRSFGL